MGRDTGAKCKICRREGEKLYLKGKRCYSGKCAVERRSYRPGEHGRRRRRESDFALQLREKQKVRAIYRLREKQFRNYFRQADNSKEVTGEKLLQLLERRLDNVVYRMKFATSKDHARELVSHGNILVNGEKVDIPSYRVDLGHEIKVNLKGRSLKNLKRQLEQVEEREIPEWVSVEEKEVKGTVTRLPHREDITFPVEEQQVVEYYSK